ncbi:hypothetical protein NL676_023213 [Syzygium grande]|nr:hypothetical protein NL676_023213 [Syzygium grande]
MSRSGVEIRCSHCREIGHNKSGCHLKKQHQLLEQPSGGTQIGSSAAPAQELAEGAAERPVGGPADTHADCLAEGPAEGQVQEPAEEPTEGPGSRATSFLTIAETRKKYPLRRKPTEQAAQVPQSEAPYQTRGALGRRLRQYGYGIYTDFNTGMTILHPGRSSEVLISQVGPSQESRAHADSSKIATNTSKKKIFAAPKKKSRARMPVEQPAGPAVEKDAAGAVQEEAPLAVEEDAAQAVQEEAAPVIEEDVAPAIQEEVAPVNEEPASSEEQLAVQPGACKLHRCNMVLAPAADFVLFGSTVSSASTVTALILE